MPLQSLGGVHCADILASKSAVKAVISQELDTISRLAKENNWGKRKIQKEIRMLQSEVKKGVIKCH